MIIGCRPRLQRLRAIVTAIAAATIPALAFGAQASSSSDPAAMSQRLQGFVGCWKIVGREMDTRGDTFAQTGIALVRLDQATGGIRFDERFLVTEAAGAYLGVPDDRRFSESLSFDPVTRMFALRDPTDVNRPPTRVSVSVDGTTATRTFMIRSGSRNLDLISTHRMQLISPSRVEVLNILRDPNSYLQEFYVAVWTRAGDDDPECAELRA